MEANHPAAPVAALAASTPEEPPSGPQSPSQALRRRERDGALRARIVQVRCNDDEYARIRGRAEAAGVSPPRLLVELALQASTGLSERHANHQALALMRRQVVGMATNLNQLAKWANTRQQVPPGLEATLTSVQRILERLDAFVADLRGER